MALTSYIGIHGFMWLYAIFSLTAALFTYLFIPETKGKSIEGIAYMFKHGSKAPQKSLYE